MARTYEEKEDGTIEETGSISERKEKKLAQNISGMPDYVYESIKRQYSGKDYTIEDKKNVINYHLKQQRKKGKI